MQLVMSSSKIYFETLPEQEWFATCSSRSACLTSLQSTIMQWLTYTAPPTISCLGQMGPPGGDGQQRGQVPLQRPGPVDDGQGQQGQRGRGNGRYDAPPGPGPG